MACYNIPILISPHICYYLSHYPNPTMFSHLSVCSHCTMYHPVISASLYSTTHLNQFSLFLRIITVGLWTQYFVSEVLFSSFCHVENAIPGLHQQLCILPLWLWSPPRPACWPAKPKPSYSPAKHCHKLLNGGRRLNGRIKHRIDIH